LRDHSDPHRDATKLPLVDAGALRSRTFIPTSAGPVRSASTRQRSRTTPSSAWRSSASSQTRSGVPLCRLRTGVPRAGHRAEVHTCVSTAIQRQGRTLHL